MPAAPGSSDQPSQSPRESASSSGPGPSQRHLSIAEYREEYERRHGSKPMASSTPGRGQTSGQLDLDDPLTVDYTDDTPVESPARGHEPSSPEHQGLRTPNPFPERSSLEEGELAEPDVITNPLDEAQSLELERELHRPEARPLLSEESARHEYRFVVDPAKAADDAAKGLLLSYIIGPPATAASQREQREKLRERHLTPQATTKEEYAQRLIDQDQGKSVPAINTVAVVLRPGESLDEADARFQNWVERARKLSSIHALRASFSKQDIYLERRLRFKFAKHEVSDLLQQYYLQKRSKGATAEPARARHSSARSDISSTQSSAGKRGSSDDAPSSSLGASGVPDHKRQQRQGNPAGVESRTPRMVTSRTTSQDTGFDPCAGGASTASPRGSGAAHAHRATPGDDEPPLDRRAASTERVFAMEQAVGRHSEDLQKVWVEFQHRARHLEEDEKWIDTVERRQSEDVTSLKTQLGELSRQHASDLAAVRQELANLHGQLDMLARMGSQPQAVYPTVYPTQAAYPQPRGYSPSVAYDQAPYHPPQAYSSRELVPRNSRSSDRDTA